MRKRKSKPKLPPDCDLKYMLYEAAVQDPRPHVRLFDQIFYEVGKGKAKLLREDFCGTFALSQEWVKSRKDRYAIGLDLDPEPLSYGITTGLRKMKPSVRSRVTLYRKNVISRTKPLADIAVACNFSFNIFQDRKTLLRYFRCVRSSLRLGGVFVLELAGGPGMIEKGKEMRKCRHRVLGRFEYEWDQREFDAITRRGLYSIHFRLPGQRKLKHAFEYDWRMWTIPEIRDALRDAGFGATHVYWELGDEKGEGTGEFVRSETGDNSYSWIAQVVGVLK